MMGPGGGLDRGLELGGDDVGEARLAHARGPEEEHVVEGLAPAARGLDGHPQVGDHLRLARRTRRGVRGRSDWSKPRSSSMGRAETMRGSASGLSGLRRPATMLQGARAAGPRTAAAVLAQRAVDALSASPRE